LGLLRSWRGMENVKEQHRKVLSKQFPVREHYAIAVSATVPIFVLSQCVLVSRFPFCSLPVLADFPPATFPYFLRFQRVLVATPARFERATLRLGIVSRSLD
jgi:hypothetical protein